MLCHHCEERPATEQSLCAKCMAEVEKRNEPENDDV